MAALSVMIANSAKRAIYAAGQTARVLWHTSHYMAGRRMMGPLTAPGDAPYAEEFGPLDRQRLKESFRDAFRNDWKNIEAGLYKFPLELRRPPSPARLLRQSRDYLTDAGRVARRKAARGHGEVLTDALQKKYPRYYLQNFHYQTDGWLTAASAERYEMQVETLFTGAGGPMRRAALPLIADALRFRDIGQSALLDMGCGAGNFLASVKDNWPALHICALDLSPAYLGKARANLGRWKDVEFVAAKAEETGLPDASFDIVTAIYLFHELPPKVRQRGAAEIARLLKPGGAFILLDTIQYGDEPGLDILLENFPRGFYEPYFDSYCRADLSALFGAAGLTRENEAVAFLSKAIRFTKRRRP
jgi:ubiquinone/menaquinone biosynthesis C-methylase UbiE